MSAGSKLIVLPTSELGGERRAFLLKDIDKADFCALRREGAHNGLAYPARSAGNETVLPARLG